MLPPWHAHPDAWLLVLLLGGGYAAALRWLGPRFAPKGEPPATRRQVASWALGVISLAVASDWPVHDLSEDYLFSVHMLQHTLLSLVAPGLLLIGLPPWLLRAILRPRVVGAVAEQVTRPFVALVLFNAVIVVTHWPAWVDLTLRSEAFHFLSHTLLFGTALCMWWPVVSPLPEMPTLSYPGRMVFLFLQSIVPTVPASFLTFGSEPMYPFYESVPRIWGLDALADQRVAGLIMKLLGGAILWAVIAVIFFRWYGEEQKTEGWDSLEWGRVEREIRSGMSGGREVARP